MESAQKNVNDYISDICKVFIILATLRITGGYRTIGESSRGESWWVCGIVVLLKAAKLQQVLFLPLSSRVCADGRGIEGKNKYAKDYNSSTAKATATATYTHQDQRQLQEG